MKRQLLLFICFLGITGSNAVHASIALTLWHMRNLLPSYYAMQGDEQLAVKTAQLPAVTVNVKGIDGRTALHWAAQKGYAELAQALLAKGADTTIKDDAGETPLEVAQNNDQAVIASLLNTKKAGS